MGTLRKLKKTINQKEPAILFVPSDTYDPEGKDVITVSDPALYKKVREGVDQALEIGRPGVTRTEPQQRIII